MRLPSLLRCAVLIVVVAGFAPDADATPITFDISSISSGTIGGTTFTNALVTLIGRGDTADVVPVTGCDGANCFTFAADPLTTTVTIAGIGTATITDPTEIWSTEIPIPGFSASPLVIIGRIDVPPALDSITGIGFTASDTLLGYDLTKAIGPITGVGGIGFPLCGVPGRDSCLATTLGALSFTSNALGAKPSTFTATLAPVPEPVSLLLMGSGLAAMIGRSRFRARR